MSGYHTFNDLDILTAAHVNGYLMSQTVPRFASAAARNAAIPAPEVGQLCFVVGVGLLLYDGAAWGSAVAGGTQLVQRQTLTANAASVSFNAIPAWKNLRVLYSARSDGAAFWAHTLMRINNNSGLRYQSSVIQASGLWLNAAVGGMQHAGGDTSAQIGIMPAASVGNPAYFGAGTIDIPSWTLPAGRSTLQFLGTSTTWWTDVSASAYISQHGGLADLTGPFTSLQLFPSIGNWIAGSEFSVYGMA